MSANTPILTIQLEGNVVQTVQLNMPVLTIGRTPDNALSLPHPMVSRKHAEIRMSPEGAILTDLGSANGTFIDGNRMLPQQPLQLAHGLAFTIGPFVLTYQGQAAEEVSESEVAADPVAVEEPVQPVVTGRAPVVEALPPRPTFPANLPDIGASSYPRYLPVIYQENDFLGRFLQIFEAVWEPLEQRQDHIELYFDPPTAPAQFLPWLAGWMDFSISTHWPEARVRRLVAEAMELYRWRGTRYGLQRVLEIRTGLLAQVTDVPNQPFVFKVKIDAQDGKQIDRALIEEVIDLHKPAHAGYILELGAAS